MVDTNVLVSAALQPLGPPAQILRCWQRNEIELIVCPELLAELTAVVARPRMRERVGPAVAVAYVALLRSQGELRADPTVVRGLTSDPKDDYIVALARTARADFILSGDAHLTERSDVQPPVLAPAAFLERLREPGPGS